MIELSEISKALDGLSSEQEQIFEDIDIVKFQRWLNSSYTKKFMNIIYLFRLKALKCLTVPTSDDRNLQYLQGKISVIDEILSWVDHFKETKIEEEEK